MDPSIDATKNEISSSEEEETKGLEKKDNNQTTLNLLKQPQSIGDSATATAIESGGAEPSQLTASLAAEEAGQKEDVGTCPDSAEARLEKGRANEGDHGTSPDSFDERTVIHGTDEREKKVEEAQKIHSEKSDNDPGTASVAPAETEKNEEEDGLKPPVQPKPCVQEQSKPKDGEKYNGQKQESSPTVQHVQDQSSAEEALLKKGRANDGDHGTCPDSFDERTVIHGADEREEKVEEAQKIHSEKSDNDPGTASVAPEETEENEEDGGKILKTQKPPAVQMESPVQEQLRADEALLKKGRANDGDHGTCPDSFDERTKTHGTDEREKKVEEAQKIHSEKSDNDPGTASVAPEETEENEEEDGLKPRVQPKPCVQEQSRPEGPFYMKMAVLMAGLAVIIGLICFDYSSERPAPRTDSKIDIFHREFEKMKSSFPSQREELWKRSKIHLEKHLQTAEPTEPVSMILTAGRRAEGTLRCLASRMAATFSSTLGASVLHIDGASRAALESGQVKLDIDEQLGGAFEGNRRSAVIHRFEELPPGSTLIFYRYCDHENAAYKESFLIFTVLLEEEDLKSHLSLSAVEEIVQDHIQDKFLSSTHPTSFDKMDVDKFSGLWSRISHLILPVAVEELMEMQGCEI
ncbi:hypothetical protein GJAV_G00082490 [Gymnothorax javanicus]|nr:hypothetical protein GJAV_G00082490 [Gymnothorax javanicus]